MQGSGFKSSKRKGSTMARRSTKYAPRAKYNDDPRTGFSSYPLSTNRNEFFSKVTGIENVIQATGGSTFYSISLYINYPTYLYQSAFGNVQTQGFPQNLDNQIALFSEYTVSSFTLTYTPYFTEATPNANFPYVPNWYTTRELTDQNNIASEDQALNGAGTKSHSIYKPMIRKVYPQNATWMATNNAVPSFSSITSLTNVGVNPLESVKVFFPILSNNVSYGRLVCQWNIRWRGLTVDTT